MLLTVEMLRHYQRCSRRAFLDVYGDPTRQDFQNDFRAKLQQDRYALQQTILAGRTYHKPNFPYGDWDAGANATKVLMQQGVELIYRGVLLADFREAQEYFVETTAETNDQLPPGISLISRPDLLVKQPGQSIFGDWIYVPTDIHLGKRPKQEYQIVAAYHALLLATMQGVLPSQAWLMLRRPNPHFTVNLSKCLPQMQSVCLECIEMLLQEQEPEVFISRHRCNLCPWLNECYGVAKSQQHISLLAGVTPSRYQYLRSLGLTSVELLANADFTELEPVLGEEAAQLLICQAQCAIANQAMPLTSSSQQFTIPKDLLASPIELYFDIEAEPGLDLDYLLGVLVVDRQAKTETFHPFVAEQPASEGLIWQQFLDLVTAYPQAPIFHFCDYEVLTVKRLAKCYNTPREVRETILSRFVDTHLWVTTTVTMPVESYALKPIAHWLGFEWRDPGANGQLSIYWYDQWLKTGDRTFLDTIIRYNEDDCRATHHLKDWLVNFLQDL